MSQHEDITQIRVGKAMVGIVGLQEALAELAKEYAEQPYERVKAELLSRLSKKNYIPDRSKEQYGEAFLKEFKKFLGRPYEEEGPQGLEIKVLGPGCTECDRLEQEVMGAMAESGLMGDIEHVRDPKEIGKYGVMGTPSLMINGKVKSVGKVPSRKVILEWLKEAS